MPGPAFLSGDRVSLHPVEEADHDFLQRNLNHPAVRPGFGAATPLAESAVEEYVDGFHGNDESELFLVCAGDPDGPDRSADDPDSPDRSVYGSDGPEKAIGVAFCFDLDPQRGNVEIGYWIAPGSQGNGYATAAAALLVEYLVTERRLHKVNARVLAFNDGSRRVLEKLGFEREGCRRDDFYVDGEYADADLYGLVADEWDRSDDEE